MAAKKKISAKSRKKLPAAMKAPEGVAIKVVPDLTGDIPTYYVNYADVGHGQHEFSLMAMRVPIRLTKGEQERALSTQQLEVEPFVQLLFPPAVMVGLGDAIRVQLEKYEARFGKINKGDPE